MAQRHESQNSVDDFPTPPWATRAFLESVLGGKSALQGLSCLEPACHRGHMSMPLAEYFSKVKSSDIVEYGFGEVANFLAGDYPDKSFDWVITNPPFKIAEDFVQEGLRVARLGVAMLVRTVFIESIGRYERLFLDTKPAIFAQYTERVAMVKGRLDRKASTATGYGWVVWSKFPTKSTELVWIPPSRKKFELDTDYPQSDPQLNMLR
jgi:hypothetical protein